MSSLSKSLIDAYSKTNYSVLADKIFVLKVGEKSDELKDLYMHLKANSCVFITASNPFSKVLTFEDNKSRNKALRNELDELSLVVFDGYGQDTESLWDREDSFLALNIAKDDALRLGKKYEQNAIIWCDADFTPQLILLK